ncbi:MAG: putative metal chaperone YciC [Planctomycetes bacterium ADurb.Bin126]|nr:MAG: putative metal chaperone YciC [Planctomycetes bacterium ADurb.Bin126]HOD84203.1 GTP-binding protein [Phycisphaerae bacterium]HQL74976.1 GTP-binding protein [Phycisphaerae bacterium]
MAQARMILVGGFLGVGKTTLLATAAGLLARRGVRVGLVTNDQAAGLVDSEALRSSPGRVDEVAGACFCCAFNRLMEVCETLIRQGSEVLIGEPVGSCTDLSATVLQPIKKYCSHQVRLAPYTVLVEPSRLAEALGLAPSDLGDDVRYIYRKQVEEADLVVLNKIDTISPAHREELAALLDRVFPDTPVLCLSARDEQQVEQWLSHVLEGSLAGERVVEVDYDVYARGEAALGWLNATVELSSRDPADWDDVGQALTRRLREGLAALGAEVAHLKLLLTTREGKSAANLTSSSTAPDFRGRAGRGRQATLLINARVQSDPQTLRTAVEQALAETVQPPLAARMLSLANFSPARPTPVHRFDAPA